MYLKYILAVYIVFIHLLIYFYHLSAEDVGIHWEIDLSY